MSGLLYSILPLVLFVALVYFVARSRSGNGVTARQALETYIYFVIGASVITAAVGLVFFVRVAISQAYNSNGIRDDVILASVLAGTGLVICVLHLFGKRMLEQQSGKPVAAGKRAYLFTMLFGFGIAGLVSLPLAIYAITDYYVVEAPRYGTRHAPSTELAVATVTVTMWAYYLFRVLREIKKPDQSEIQV